MKKALFFAAYFAIAIGLSGCSSTPNSTEETPSVLFTQLQEISKDTLNEGGLVAIGVAESKSLDIAINKAKNDGRIKLADLLEAKIEALPKEIAEETTQTIIADHIQGLVAKELKHEATNGVTTAYALMELDSQILNQEIKTLSGK